MWQNCNKMCKKMQYRHISLDYSLKAQHFAFTVGRSGNVNIYALLSKQVMEKRYETHSIIQIYGISI